MAHEVVHRPGTQRYDLVDGDRVLGFTEYRSRGGALEFPHTVIDPGERGRGLGAVLVAGALDDVRARGLTIVPTCWYVAEFVERNPGYRDLLA